MIKNFINSFLRILLKNKVAFLIKGLGIIASMSLVLLITTYVEDEIKFDKFHANHDRIYRITSSSNYNGNESKYSRTPVPLLEKVNELTGIKSGARMFNREVIITTPGGDNKFKEPNMWFSDSTITQIFSFLPIQGSVDRGLSKPQGLLISRSSAYKYFGTTDVVGKTLLIENQLSLEITAVFEDYPDQSSFDIDFIVPFQNYLTLEDPGNRAYLTTDWVYSSVFTFVLASNHVTKNQVDRGLMSLLIPDERVSKNTLFSAQPLDDIHLYSQFTGEQSIPRILYIFMFTAIGIVLFLIAIINYTSLSSTEWINRSKEFTVRRVMGSSRGQISIQFVVESMLFSIVIIPLSLVSSILLIPTFNIITLKNFTPVDLLTPGTLLLLVVFSILYVGSTALTLLLSRHTHQNPNSKRMPLSNNRFLTIPPALLAQATLSFVIASLALVITRQLSFVEKKSLGFEKENILTLPLFSENFNSIIGRVDGPMRARMNYFEDEVLKSGAIKNISCSAFRPGEGTISALVTTDSLREENNIFIALNSVDYDFLDTYNIQLISGRNFSRDFGSDHIQAFIINREAVKLLGFKSADLAIGKNINVVGKTGQVIGVMENFHFEGLQNAIRPLVFEVAAWKFSTFSVRLDRSQTEKGIEVLSTKWKEIFPESVFEYHFLENDLATNYQFERSLGKLTRLVSIITVLLSLLGMLALARQQAIKRIKEMTIRKILGASSVHLLFVFSKPFLIVLTCGFLISIPFVFKLGTSWLETFAYHIQLSLFELLGVFGVSFILAFLVLVGQMIKVAQINPIENLRSE